jgi:hypothetical protein
VDGSTPGVRVHARTEADAARVRDELDAVVGRSPDPVAPTELIHARVGLDGA